MTNAQEHDKRGRFKKARSEHRAHLRMVWRNMHTRCYDPNSNSYHNYGGRNIEVGYEWHDFDNFMYDMEPTYKKGLTLDRIDNNGDYCKNNCRWATHKQQANNRRSSRLVTVKGETRTLAQWIEKLELNDRTVRQRLYYGWSINKALGVEDV